MLRRERYDLAAVWVGRRGHERPGKDGCRKHADSRAVPRLGRGTTTKRKYTASMETYTSDNIVYKLIVFRIYAFLFVSAIYVSSRLSALSNNTHEKKL